MKIQLASLVAAVAVTGVASAGVIVDTLGTNDRANLGADGGQSFTTGSLGADTQLSTIEIQAARDNGPGTPNLGPFVLALYNDVDQDSSTMDLGSLVGTSSSGTLVLGDGTNNSGAITTFSFAGLPTLADNTVYVFRFEDGAGNAVDGVRVGLTNGTNGGATPLADGSVFSAGATAFGDAFDTSMRVTTVPEPGSLALLGLGGLAMLRRRRA